MSKNRKKIDYIDNAEFLDEIVRFYELRKQNSECKITEKLGEMIMLVARNLGKKGNFSGYSYIDEMILDGVEDCIKALNRQVFSVDKGNAHAYFTTIIWYAFLRRIKDEKKENYKKYKLVEQDPLLMSMLDKDMVSQVISDYERSYMK